VSVARQNFVSAALALIALALFVVAGSPAGGPQPVEAGDILPSGGSPTPTPACGTAWRLIPSVNVGAGTNVLLDVEAVAVDDVWAVGYYTTPEQLEFALIEHGDGAQWSALPNPPAGGLYALDVISANDIWAVGFAGFFPEPYTAITLHWDGSAWSQVPTPNPGTRGAQLLGVSAVAPNDVWAVGYYVESNRNHTLALHWDGTVWTQVDSPNPAANSEFDEVRAISANDVWAVGGYAGASQPYTPMLQHWDGTSWSVVSLTIARGFLHSLAHISANDVWAVGYVNNTGVFQTLTLHWNGQVWSQIPSPNPGLTYNFLYGASALSSNDVWAVGRGNGTLALHWDGTQWSVVPSPNVQGGGNLSAVFALASDDVWAVGDYYNNLNANLTIIERYFDPCPPTTPTASATPTVTATGTSTRTQANTPPPSSTATRTRTGTPGTTATPTSILSATRTPTGPPGATATPCPMLFTDVLPSDYFYEAVRYLYCAGVVTGYSDNTFRPYNDTTRGQLTKIVVLAEGWTIYVPPSPTFDDVPADHTFYTYVETAYRRGIISGYADGTFRPGNNVTRGQLSKIIVLAEEWALYTPPVPTFSDVPEEHPFFGHIETAYSRGIISGYADGTFRPGNNATRGQICKIVYNAIR
jgi:hypothetical protein